MSEVKIIYIIRQTPSFNRIWDKLSTNGKHRVIELANGSDFMLDTILQDVLEDELEG